MSISDDDYRKRAAFIAKECAGIQPIHEVFYLQSIIYAADRAYASFARFDAAAEKETSAASTFALVQEALAHAGALSRFFWPMKQSGALAQSRGGKLREAFGLTDASPLRERRLRNAFEHFDEDLDRFLLSHDAGTFFPDPRIGDHTVADSSTDKIFKLVDPDAGICVLLGQKFEYEPIRREIERVLGQAGAGGHHGRLPQQGEIRSIEPSEAYERFHANWAPRLGLKDKHIVESFRHAHDRNWDEVSPDEVPHTPGQVRILLRLESANLLGSVEPDMIDTFVEEWRHQLVSRRGDHRVFTRQFIAQYMALNRHRGEEADILLCAALWLIVTHDDLGNLVTTMQRGDIEVRYDITFLDDDQKFRLRLSTVDLR